MNKGYITPEQPLAQFIEKYTDSTSGEYVLGPAGCTVKDTATDKQPAAMSVFLLDYTTIQTINGENDEPEETTGPQTSGDNDIVKARLVESQGKGQNVELQASNISILGDSNPEEYPIQPKKHSLTF